jgi:hypothetical protein
MAGQAGEDRPPAKGALELKEKIRSHAEAASDVMPVGRNFH